MLSEVFIKTLLRTIFSLFYRVKIKGIENYFAAGKRIVIIANHTSFIDAALLATFLPEKLTFAVNSHVAKKWWIRFFLKLVDAFPLDPTNPMAIKSLVDFVQGDRKCIIFPEGRLTMTGSLMKIYEGPGMIADKAGAKLLPIRIDGAQFTPFSRLKGKVRIRWFPKIVITIFPAQQLKLLEEIKGRLRRQIIGYKLYDLMTDVMFESSDYQKTFFYSLIDAKKTHGRHHEILEDIERLPLNYQQFILRCFVLGQKISKFTIANEYVGILLPNMISNAITFFALQAYCRIPTLLNYTAGTYQIITACQTAQLQTIFTSQKFIHLAKLNNLIDEIDKIGITVIYLEDIQSSINLRNKIMGSLFTKFPTLSYKWLNNSHKHLMNENAAAVVLFTSGSEGKPKGVVLSHKNIQSNRFQLGACVDFNASDKVFNALPLFHSFGLMGGLLLPLLSGVKTFLYPSPLHYRIVPELTYDTNATILFGTDTFLASYAKHAHPYDFYSIRYVFAGAEKLRPETHHQWSVKFGVRIFEGYGATETSPILSTNTPMQNKAGTVGRFLPGLQYRMEEVPGIEQGGVLYVKGPNVMKGYLLADNPGVLVPPEDGWYNTGDIVDIDEAGFITIKGRAKRFAKIGGEMVSLTMVEQQISSLWPNYQHAVINIADPKKGEQLMLITTYSEAKREDILSYAKSIGMTELAVPKKMTIIEKMPLLGSGKIDYKELINFV